MEIPRRDRFAAPPLGARWLVLGGGNFIGGLYEEFRVHLRLRLGVRTLRDDRQWLSEFRVLQSMLGPEAAYQLQ